MSILVKQYLMPDGRTQYLATEQPPEVEAKAHEMLDFGFVFDIEMLQTGAISMTCMWEHNRKEICLSQEISSNGPEITEKTKLLVENAYTVWKSSYTKLKPVENDWRKQLLKLEEARNAWMPKESDDNYPIDEW